MQCGQQLIIIILVMLILVMLDKNESFKYFICKSTSVWPNYFSAMLNTHSTGANDARFAIILFKSA